MGEFAKTQSQKAQDFKERFEFKLTMRNRNDGTENIIIQRYFKINNFNPLSLSSYELVETIQNCANKINTELKFKTQTYLEIFAPKYFDTVEQMNKYFSVPWRREQMHLGEGIVVKENTEHNYFWSENGPVEANFKFDEGELNSSIGENDIVDYKFAFYDNEREVCSTVWEGIYPKYVRNSIDLSNKRGKFDGEDLDRLSFEQYLLYKMVEGRTDMVYNIIKDICATCSCQDNSWFTTSDVYNVTTGGKEKKKYNNVLKNCFVKQR